MTNSLELLAKIAAMKADNPSPPSKMEFNNVLSAKQLTPTNTNRSNTTTTNVKVEISDDEESHVSSITSDSTNSKEDESTATAPTKSDSMSSDKESKTKSEPPAKPTKQKAQTPVILPPYPPMHSYHHHPYYPYHYPMHPYGFAPPPPYGYGSHPVYHPHHQAKPHTAATHPKPAKAKKAKPVVAKPTRRAKWTEQEDVKLRSLVQELGASKWSRIALSFPHRNAKQCRARWVDEINPTIVKGDWTPSDDQAIFLGVVHVGTRWASIAKTLKGRYVFFFECGMFQTSRLLWYCRDWELCLFTFHAYLLTVGIVCFFPLFLFIHEKQNGQFHQEPMAFQHQDTRGALSRVRRAGV